MDAAEAADGQGRRFQKAAGLWALPRPPLVKGWRQSPRRHAWSAPVGGLGALRPLWTWPGPPASRLFVRDALPATRKASDYLESSRSVIAFISPECLSV